MAGQLQRLDGRLCSGCERRGHVGAEPFADRVRAHLLPRVICVRCYCVGGACASPASPASTARAPRSAAAPGGTLHDAHSLADALLQRLPTAEAAEASAHRSVFRDCGGHRAAASRAFLQWSRVRRQAYQHRASSDSRRNSRAFRLFLLILQHNKIVIFRHGLRDDKRTKNLRGGGARYQRHRLLRSCAHKREASRQEERR